MRSERPLFLSLFLFAWCCLVSSAAWAAKLNEEFRVSTATAGQQGGPISGTYSRSQSVAGLSNGGFVAVWHSNNQDGSSWGIYGQRYRADGLPIGSEFRVNTHTSGSQIWPKVAALANGGFVVVWQSENQYQTGWDVFGQRYSASGTPAGQEFRINTYTSNHQRYPTAIGLTNGDFAVFWESVGQDGSGSGVYGQIYLPTGQQLGTEFRINGATGGTQWYPAASALVDGGFLVAWAGSSDGSEWGIFARRFSATGAPSSGEFVVNTFTTGSQWAPSVAGLRGGGFVVVWESMNQDGSSLGVYGQRYLATGTRSGNEFRVNSSIDLEQQLPAVASLSDGGFVVAWQSNHRGGTWGAFAQAYSETGARLGGETPLFTYAGYTDLVDVAGLSDGNFIAIWSSYAQDGDGYGVYGKRRSVPSRKAPVQLLPAESAKVSDTSVTLSWSAVSNAAAYSVGLRDLETYQLASIPLVLGTSVTVPVERGRRYRWDVASCWSRIGGDNESNCPNRSADRHFAVEAEGPSAPNLTLPANDGQLGNRIVTLSWEPSSSAAAYSVGLRDLYTQKLVAVPLTSEPSTTVTLVRGRLYRWDVASCISASGGDTPENCPNRSADRTFSVSAAGCHPISLSTTSLQVGKSGTSSAVTVNAPPDCEWTATSSADWIRIVPSEPSGMRKTNSRTGPATLVFDVLANVALAREAVIVFGGGPSALQRTGQIVLRVAQDALAKSGGILAATDSKTLLAGRRPLIFIHGWCGDASTWDKLQQKLESTALAQQYKFYKFNWPTGDPGFLDLMTCANNGNRDHTSARVKALAETLKKNIDEEFGPSAPVSFIAHSMGGLIARSYMQELDGTRRTGALITLATPHHGTSDGNEGLGADLSEWDDKYAPFYQPNLLSALYWDRSDGSPHTEVPNNWLRCLNGRATSGSYCALSNPDIDANRNVRDAFGRIVAFATNNDGVVSLNSAYAAHLRNIDPRRRYEVRSSLANEKCEFSYPFPLPGEGHVAIHSANCGARRYGSAASLEDVHKTISKELDIQLRSGMSKTNLSGPAGSVRDFVIDVPTGATALQVTSTAEQDVFDIELHVWKGKLPVPGELTSSPNCWSRTPGSAEDTCEILNPPSGRYHILIRGVTPFAGVSVTATIN